MAQTDEDVVSLTRLRDEFRLPANYTGKDRQLVNIRGDAIAEIASKADVPLVDTTKTIEAIRPCGSEGLSIDEDYWISEVKAVRYWTDVNAIGTPTESFTDIRLSRVPLLGTRRILVVPGLTGWPNIPSRTVLVDLLRSVDARPDIDIRALRAAVVLAAHSLFEGTRSAETQRAIDDLVASVWRAI